MADKPLGEVLTFQRVFDITKDQQRDGPYSVFSSSGPKSSHTEFKVSGPGVIIGSLGVDNFLLAYATGLLQYGYEQSPLEQMAFQLQARFDQQRVPENLVDFINERTDGVWDTAQQFLQAG